MVALYLILPNDAIGHDRFVIPNDIRQTLWRQATNNDMQMIRHNNKSVQRNLFATPQRSQVSDQQSFHHITLKDMCVLYSCCRYKIQRLRVEFRTPLSHLHLRTPELALRLEPSSLVSRRGAPAPRFPTPEPTFRLERTDYNKSTLCYNN